jgi:Kef-type K+ transport system membrane component KefB
MDQHETQLVLVALLTVAGLYFGKIARKVKLPSLIGYMMLGVVLGVSCLNVLGEESLEHLKFITEMSLGFVAFAIGSELNLKSLGKQGSGIISIILCESFGAFLVVFVGIYAITGDLPLALMFAAIAPASAPAGTVAVIHEYKAKGSLTKVLYAVVGFDDALAIGIYAVAAALARGMLSREVGAETAGFQVAFFGVVQEIGLSLLVGVGIGLAFSALVARLRSNAEVFVLVFGAVAAGVGLSLYLHTSLILTNMVIGFILSNLRREEEVRRVMQPVSQFMPLIFVLFFGLAGSHLNLRMLPSLGLVGVAYILCRTFGLMAGSRLGAVIGGAEDKIRKYVGLGILSQAGVAIGLALITKEQFAALHLKHASIIGSVLITTVTATSIVFEIVGPLLTKIALQKAGEIKVPEKN